MVCLISPEYLVLSCKIDHNYLIFIYATKNTVKISEIHVKLKSFEEKEKHYIAILYVLSICRV